MLNKIHHEIQERLNCFQQIATHKDKVSLDMVLSTTKRIEASLKKKATKEARRWLADNDGKIVSSSNKNIEDRLVGIYSFRDRKLSSIESIIQIKNYQNKVYTCGLQDKCKSRMNHIKIKKIGKTTKIYTKNIYQIIGIVDVARIKSNFLDKSKCKKILNEQVDL